MNRQSISTPIDRFEEVTSRDEQAVLDVDLHAGLLSLVLYISTGILLVAVLIWFFSHTGEPHIKELLSVFASLLVILLAWRLQQRGQVRLAILIFCWGVWSAINFQASIRGGLHTPGLLVFPLIMFMSSWMLGARQGRYFAIASIVAILIHTAGLYAGAWTVTPALPVLAYGLVMAGILLVSHVILMRIHHNHWDRMNKIQGLTQRLQQTVSDLQAREIALRDSEQRFAKVGLVSPLPIAISELKSGRYLDVNPAWEHMFGWSRTEALGKTSVELHFWPDPIDRDNWLGEFRAKGLMLNRQIRAQSRDGTQLHVLLNAELIDYKGTPCVLAIILDQTDRLRIEAEVIRLNIDLEDRVAQRTTELQQAIETLQRMQQELVQSDKLAALGGLVAGIAHELNTPIGNALTASTTLSDTARRFEKSIAKGGIKRSELNDFITSCREGADLVERSLHRAGDLVHSFKQVAIDQASERMRPFDLAAMVSEVIDTLRPNLKHKPWRLDVDIPAGIAMNSFPGPLGQVIMNLVLNATIHAFEGRDHGTVAITAWVDGAWVELCCRDDGIGIPSETLGMIFDPFYTTKLGHGGSGLGLSITHRLTTQVLAGQITVSSSSAGTLFRLRLPRHAPAGTACKRLATYTTDAPLSPLSRSTSGDHQPAGERTAARFCQELDR